MIQTTFRAMGSQITIIMDTDTPDAVQRIGPAVHWFKQWEQTLSRFQHDSELNRLNAHAGKGPIKVHGDVWQVLMQARVAATQSDGLVTPTVLHALEHAGYDRDFARVSPDASTPFQQQIPHWREIEIDPIKRTVSLPAGMRLDFGGVAKGWAADLTVRTLQQYAPTLVDAGGDIAVSGPRSDGSAWAIAIANPFDPEDTLGIIMVQQGGVATSGRDYRRWQRGDVWQHHIIDPRTGAPAETDLISVTVQAADVSEAEMAAKAVLIQGSTAGMAWLHTRPNLAALLVLEDGSIIHTPNAHEWMRAVMS